MGNSVTPIGFGVGGSGGNKTDPITRLTAARFDGPQALYTEAVRQIKTARNDGAKEMLDAVCEGILDAAKFAGSYGQPKTEKLLRDMSAEIREEVAKEMVLE